jgi:5'(3')-deoxyribonucleotidase
VKIYLDMDGVLADFDAGLAEHGVSNKTHDYFHTPKSTWTEQMKQDDQAIVDCMSKPGWFFDLPVMEGALELVDASLKLGQGVGILTALPAIPKDIASHKLAWVHKHLKPFVPYLEFHCVVRSQKQDFAETYNREGKRLHSNILVDDLERNIREWNVAGGKGVLFKNSNQAIKELEQIVVNG